MIGDFRSGKDRIEIDAGDFGGGLIAGALDPDAFRTNASGRAKDADDRFIYNLDTGNLFFDADGNGAGGGALVAWLDGAPGLDADDFIVVGGGGEGLALVFTAAPEARLFGPAHVAITGGGGAAEMRGFELVFV